MADAEGVIGELKNRHGLDRVRSRGTPLFHVQLLLGCAAINYKRLADRLPEATSGVAGAPQVAPSALQPASAARGIDQGTQSPASHALGCTLAASPSTWNYIVCLN
jgi:hypothetical protein